MDFLKHRLITKLFSLIWFLLMVVIFIFTVLGCPTYFQKIIFAAFLCLGPPLWFVFEFWLIQKKEETLKQDLLRDFEGYGPLMAAIWAGFTVFLLFALSLEK
jgi:hypothetical protein